MSSPAPMVLDERRFDVVLLGTSLTNTILAAALAKSGKKVLHLDANDFYANSGAADSVARRTGPGGGSGALQLRPPSSRSSLPLVLLCHSAFAPITTVRSSPSSLPNDSAASPPSASSDVLPSPSPSPSPSSSPPTPPSSLTTQSRHFSLDLTPGLVLSRSSLVELMILSNVSGYVDFKAVDSSYLCPSQPEGALRVPISRADVFVSELIGMHEKRKLMRLLQSIAPNHKVSAEQGERDRREIEEWSERPFADFLASRDLSPRLTAFVAYAIALLDYPQVTSSSSPSSTTTPSSNSHISTRDGVARMRGHFLSIGRYGLGAFLYPIYALGELPQAFARLCAVHGGVFILRFPPLALVTDAGERRVKGVVTQAGQVIEADAVVSDWEYVGGGGGGGGGGGEVEMVSCGVCVVDGPLIDGKGQAMDQLVQCVFPPHTCSNLNVVRILQLGDAVKAAPTGLCILHLHTLASGAAQDDLQPIIEYLTSTAPSWAPAAHRRPNLLYSAFHQRRLRPAVLPSSTPPTPSPSSYPSPFLTSGAYSNLLITSDSSPLNPLDAHVDEAASMLRRLCPELELMAAMTATRAGADEEVKEELEELDILNSVIGVEERKEGEGEGEGQGAYGEAQGAIIEQGPARPPSEQKTTAAALDESAILDSLDDLTFE